MVKNEMKVAQPVSEQEYQLTQLLEHVTIEQCEDGKLRIANFPTIKDTLQAMTEDLSTNIVLTTEESTVDTARKAKKTLNTFIDDVKKSEDEVQTQIKPLLAQTKDLKKIATFDIIWYNAKKLGLVFVGAYAITKFSMFLAGLYLSNAEIASYGLMMQSLFIAVFAHSM